MRNLGDEGFTLIELLLTLALGSIVIAGFITIFWTSSQAYDLGITATDIQYMARRAINDIERDIKEGYSVTINPAATNMLINKTDDNEIEYYLNKGNLYRKHKSSSVPIAECIDEVEFSQTDEGLVEVTIVAHSNDIKYILSTSALPRIASP